MIVTIKIGEHKLVKLWGRPLLTLSEVQEEVEAGKEGLDQRAQLLRLPRYRQVSLRGEARKVFLSRHTAGEVISAQEMALIQTEATAKAVRAKARKAAHKASRTASVMQSAFSKVGL